MRGPLDRILAVLSSFHIACVCFALVLILTFVGTIYQKETLFGLYDCQRYYFESWIVPRVAWPLGIPLPGMALVFAVMFVNILAGGVLRIRKSKRTIGVVISHLSILGFFIAGAVSLWTKTEGHLQVNEKSENSIVQSAMDWVIEVRELKSADGQAPQDNSVRFIKDKFYRDCVGDRTRDFTSSVWPFTLTVGGYVRNAQIVPADDPDLGSKAPRDGAFAILALSVKATNEENIGGARVEVKDKSGNRVVSGLSTALERAPIVFETGGKRFSVSMTRERWEVPFSVFLDDFRAEYYPGTRKARAYESDIKVRHSNGNESNHLISMNNPLRDSGYVAYQTSFDDKAPPGEEKYSVFTVVKNRSDQWPLYSLIACTLGLVIHFVYKLYLFLNRNARRQEPQAAKAL